MSTLRDDFITGLTGNRNVVCETFASDGKGINENSQGLYQTIGEGLFCSATKENMRIV